MRVRSAVAALLLIVVGVGCGLAPGASAAVARVVPAPPAPLEVYVHAAGSDAATVTWTAAPGDSDSATTYTATATPVGASGSALTCTVAAPATSCTIGGITGTNYDVSVTASNSGGSSIATAAQVEPAIQIIAPPQDVKAAVSGSGAVTVTWNEGNALNDSEGPTFTVASKPAAPACAPQWNTVAGTAGFLTGTCTFTGLKAGTRYSFSVTLDSVNGDICGYIACLPSANEYITSTSVVAVTVPNMPLDVKVTPNGTALKVSWTVPNGNGHSVITGYTASVNGDGKACNTNRAGRGCTISGLAPFTVYPVTVVATNAVGTSAPSSVVSAKTGSRGTIVSTASPAIVGNPAVGSRLTAYVGTWNMTGLGYAYQWKANGKAIGGATRAIYRPTAGVAGKKLTVTVTAKKAGYTYGHATSAADLVQVGKLRLLTRPRITGRARVSNTLTLRTGRWSPAVTVREQWYANGHAIKGATGPRLKLTRRFRGERISVRLSARRAGYITRELTLSAGRIRR